MIGALWLLAVGCGQRPPTDLAGCEAFLDLGDEVWEPTAVVDGHVRAVEAENLTCALGAFHPETESIYATRHLLEDLFEGYDVILELERNEVASVEGDLAKVAFTQVSRSATDDPTYAASRITGVHHLRRHGDRWRLMATTVETREALDVE